MENQDRPLKNIFISRLRARLDIQSLDMDNEKQKFSHFVIMSMFRVHSVSHWRLSLCH